MPYNEITSTSNTRIFAICMLKNEGDIIEQCLRSAARWAHKIYVYDNGSDDGSWDIVQRMAESSTVIEPFRRDARPFQVTMRREVFEAKRHLCAPGDWWLVLDADEFYREDPRDFLDHVPRHVQAVENISIAFCMSDLDLARYEEDPSSFADEVPVHMKMRYYFANYTEPRFFRYDPSLRWRSTQAWPDTGAVHRERIKTLHYIHRSPQQIQRRIDVRRAAVQRGTTTFRHELRRSEDWRGRVAPASAMRYDAHDGVYAIDPTQIPRLPLFARLPPWLANALRGWKGLIAGDLRKTLRRRLLGPPGRAHDGAR